MTLRTLSALALAASLFTLTGCDSNDDSAACTAAGITSTGSLSATAGGASFDAACVSAQSSGGGTQIVAIENIGQAGASQRQISLVLFGSGAGTYSIGGASSGNFASATYADVDLANPTAGTFVGTSGSVSVETLTATSAKGTFSFSARSSQGSTTVQVSSGRFDVTF